MKDLTMPVLFIGHGSPMHVIEENDFRNDWIRIGQTLPVPRAILCVSAHWETQNPELCTAEHPRTIHDFYGFPQPLYEIHYPAPGAPFLLDEIRALVTEHPPTPNPEWGLDHGAWSVLRALFPRANIPVAQLSLAKSFSATDHAAFARQLIPLRYHDVMVVCSGNITHNLRMLSRSGTTQWAVEFDSYVANALTHQNLDALIHYHAAGEASHLAVPTEEHYLPLLYAAGLREKNDDLSFFAAGFDLGSLSMRSFILQQRHV